MGLNRLVRRLLNRESNFVVPATWAITVLAIGRGAWAASQRGGNDTAAYLVCIVSIALSILLTTFDSPVGNAVLGLVFIGFPVMAAASAAVPPSVGNVARTGQFCFFAIIITITVASYGAKGLRKHDVDKDKAFSQIFLWHLGIVLVMVVTTSFALTPPMPDAAWRLSNGLVVKYVNVGAGPMSQPLIVGHRCYVVNPGTGVNEIDLNRGEVLARKHLPERDQLNLGVDGAEAVRPGGFPHQALFYGDVTGQVKAAYPYPLRFERDGEVIEDRSKYIRLHLRLPFPPGDSYATIWTLGQQPDGKTISTQDAGPDVNIVAFGDCFIDRTRRSSNPSTIDVKTVTPSGESSLFLGGSDWVWIVAAGDDRALIGTAGGRVYIVTRSKKR